jgi:hypothetical protein
MASSYDRGARQAENAPGGREIEFEALSRELAEKELELATLENELSAFEARYAATVGVLLAQLDVLDGEIAREFFRLHPEDKNRQAYQKAERKARASQDAVNEKKDQAEKEPYVPTEEIKNLYRKVAKTVHPDLATSEAERVFRTNLMARANAAYKTGDKQALEQILDEWEHRDEKTFSEQAGASLPDQMEQKIVRIKIRLKEIETRIEQLKKSELHQLMEKVDRAEREGRDLLGDMAGDLRQKVLAAQKLLDGLRQRERA